MIQTNCQIVRITLTNAIESVGYQTNNFRKTVTNEVFQQANELKIRDDEFQFSQHRKSKSFRCGGKNHLFKHPNCPAKGK